MIVVFIQKKSLDIRAKKNIPIEAKQGIDEESIKMIGHFQLSDWASDISNEAYFSIFSGEVIDTKETEMRVYYSDNEKREFLGALTDQLGIEEIKTIFLDLGKERCVMGWTSSEIPGKRKAIVFGGYEPDPRKWLQVQLKSTIERDMFIIPIKEDTTSRFDFLSRVGIETKESFKRGLQSKYSYYEVEKKFEPALDVSEFYYHLEIQ